MPDDFVLIHSPLVGPFTWKEVAAELARRGKRAVVPSMLSALNERPPYWAALAYCVNQAITEAKLKEPVVLIAHSAAGSFLPAIRQRLPVPVAAYLFVDARLPKDNASLFATSPAGAEDRQRAIAKEGWLPPWSKWFGEEAMRELIPDSRLRQAFLNELRPLPLALFEEPIPVFIEWPDAPCGYVRLSDFYKPQVEEARVAGWNVLELEVAHLHMLVDPQAVTDTILEITEDL